jgi:hypothetical protein
MGGPAHRDWQVAFLGTREGRKSGNTLSAEIALVLFLPMLGPQDRERKVVALEFTLPGPGAT